MTRFLIEYYSATDHAWVTPGDHDDCILDAREDAEVIIGQLRTLGEDWATAEYRITEVEAQPS